MTIPESDEKHTKKYWVELQVETVRELSDAIMDFLVSELHRGVIVHELESEDSSHPEKVLIKAYLTQEDIEAGTMSNIEVYFRELMELHSQYSPITWDTGHIVEEDWSQDWKKYFKPVKVGQGLVIKPSWETYVPEEHETVIEIDPGRAFGVGTHASTRLMIEAIENVASKGIVQDASIIDVGTGTGILAIVAARLGAREVMAIDIDQDAVDAARKNAHLNNCHQVVSVSNTPVWEVEGPFDIVLANLDMDTFLFLSREIATLVRPEGMLIASGIITGQDRRVADAFARRGLVLHSSTSDRLDPEWVCLEFHREKQ